MVYPTSQRPQFLCPKPCLSLAAGREYHSVSTNAQRSSAHINQKVWNLTSPVGLPPMMVIVRESSPNLLNSCFGIIVICPDEYVVCEMGQIFLGFLAHLLRMVMELKFYAEKVSNTPQSSAENMTGCLGIWKLLFGWLIYISFRFHVFFPCCTCYK